MRTEDLDIHFHLPERLLEGNEEVLGVGDVATLGVWYVRKAVADVFLVAFGDAGGYLAQWIDGVRVEYKANLLAALAQSVRHRLGDEDLTQVAGVDVTGDADAANDHMRPRAERISDSLGPGGYANAGLVHVMLRLSWVVGIEGEIRNRRLAGRLDVDDLVLRRAAGGGDRDLLPYLPLEYRFAHRGSVAEFPARRVRLVGTDDLERPLLPLLADDPEGHRGPEVDSVSLDRGRVDHRHVAYPALELTDPALQQALLVLGVVILGVLRDVPEIAGLTNTIGDFLATRVCKVCQLFLELLEPLRGNELLVLVRHKPRDYKGGLESCQRGNALRFRTLRPAAFACQHAMPCGLRLSARCGCAFACQHASAFEASLSAKSSCGLVLTRPKNRSQGKVLSRAYRCGPRRL